MNREVCSLLHDEGGMGWRTIAQAGAMLCTASLLAIALAEPAFAQETIRPSNTPPSAQAEAEAGEIIVTARKRQESILKVPVVVTAVSEQTLERLQVTQL